MVFWAFVLEELELHLNVSKRPTALISSAIFRCLIRLPPNFFMVSFAWRLKRSSVIFPVGVFGRRFAYNCNSVWRSALVPNLAKSELRMVTSFSRLLYHWCKSMSSPPKKWALTLHIDRPGFSWSVSFVVFLASLFSREASVRGTDSPTLEWGITLDSLFGSSFFRFAASLLNLSLMNSSSVTLLSSLSQFFFGD